ncbi:MAG: adenylate/guanylate cyclase domain-containing protein [Deltaproteobacteria bacterium]|nr:adenylate/guanylate cyclase domain-containing protein [Deltaproteobacteria bacterium]
MTTEKPKTRLAAILMADVQGFSRLMGEDEAWADQTLRAYREVLTTHILEYKGRIVEAVGDKLLAEFFNAVEAVQAAVANQKELKIRNAQSPENRRMAFRIGINLGDVTDEMEKISGDGVQVAAKVESISTEESITTLKKALKITPNYQRAHILLAANYGSLNRDAEAATAAKEIMRINPRFTMETHAKTLTYKNKEDLEREVAALRRAGLK